MKKTDTRSGRPAQLALDGLNPHPQSPLPDTPRTAVPRTHTGEETASLNERPTPRRPPARITHGACGRSWTGLRTAHCGGCHETFSGVSLFDEHRNQHGERGSCRDPRTGAIGEVVLVDGVWHRPAMTDAERATIRWSA